ncbi:hypothetical protein TcBrA4_0102390 [Trypanosoma cruzi]|nr:hypothetical protein TcBrA4_0102390 [Trypanosoma cruzi]
MTEEAKLFFFLVNDFDVEMGARPLRCCAEKYIATEVSRMILAQLLLPNGVVRVLVSSSQVKLAFSVKRSSVA